VPLIALALVIVLAVIALIPLSLIGRFRMATLRRPARTWIATFNVVGLALSIGMFLFSAMIVSQLVPDALIYTLVGLTVGCLLGLLATKLIRWETIRGRLHYTPNKWLGLSVTLVVAARLLYGFWRSWRAWQSAIDHTDWVASSGVAGSMAAGAVVLGYYLIFWAGVRGHLRAAFGRRAGQAR
jgi:hypothetical protein